jgi:hypothetical protein
MGAGTKPTVFDRFAWNSYRTERAQRLAKGSGRHGKEGVSGSSPEEGFGFFAA